jgi:GDPmannose 4,6-dehydratase
VGLDAAKHLEIDEALFRPNEVKDLLGDPTKIKSKLGWQPKTTFENLVKEMIQSDLEDTK